MDYRTVPLDNIPDFIKWLDTLYPNKCPDPEHSEREIWMRAGERRCVESIMAKLEHMQRRME